MNTGFLAFKTGSGIFFARYGQNYGTPLGVAVIFLGKWIRKPVNKNSPAEPGVFHMRTKPYDTSHA